MNRSKDLDIVDDNLLLIFIGYNPSPVSEEMGHHYANKSNRFWKLLYQSGITERLYQPEEDSSLLSLGFGFTNIVARPTPAAADITKEEYTVGRKILREKLDKYKPKVAFFVGKGVYLQYSGKKSAQWGKQPESVIKGVIDFVGPSSSGLVRMKIADIVEIYRDVGQYIK
ncbi:mismatch-specific DNA-glycosylase [Metabacillus herbersteinensis]|uniref:Mismatch-specific DNA-glycosylase n=1 Tax=Metabacillus herbersteinensis TaxID=283816 RepID=A0ABV6GN30_9BACI